VYQAYADHHRALCYKHALWDPRPSQMSPPLDKARLPLGPVVVVKDNCDTPTAARHMAHTGDRICDECEYQHLWLSTAVLSFLWEPHL
jgi:hypothetical protein